MRKSPGARPRYNDRSTSNQRLAYKNCSLSPRDRWLATLLLWIERSRQRRALCELATHNGSLLKDIGLSQEQARREAAKPFWRR
jgi:uncharacterized protein YjiS (DUF1127 family)